MRTKGEKRINVEEELKGIPTEFEIEYHSFPDNYRLYKNKKLVMLEHNCMNYQGDRILFWIEEGHIMDSAYSTPPGIHKTFVKIAKGMARLVRR